MGKKCCKTYDNLIHFIVDVEHVSFAKTFELNGPQFKHVSNLFVQYMSIHHRTPIDRIAD